MLTMRKAQEHNEAVILKLSIEALQKRIEALELKQAAQEEKTREKLNVTSAHGYGMFDR